MKRLDCFLRALLYINNYSKTNDASIYPAFIARKLNITLPYIYPLIIKLNKKGLIKIGSIGKSKQIVISDRGSLACDHLIKFLELVGDDHLIKFLELINDDE